MDWGSGSSSSLLTEFLFKQFIEHFYLFKLVMKHLSYKTLHLYFFCFKQLSRKPLIRAVLCFPLHLHLLAFLALQLKPCSSIQLPDRWLLLSLLSLKFHTVLHYFHLLEEFEVHRVNRPFNKRYWISVKRSAVSGGLPEHELSLGVDWKSYHYGGHRSVCEVSYLSVLRALLSIYHVFFFLAFPSAERCLLDIWLQKLQPKILQMSFLHCTALIYSFINKDLCSLSHREHSVVTLVTG